MKISFEGKDIPYFAFGRAYIRTADENRQLSMRELEHLIVRKNKDMLRWDSEVCNRARLSDVSIKKLKAFLKIAGLKCDAPRNAFRKLKLLSGNKLLNTRVHFIEKWGRGISLILSKEPETDFKEVGKHFVVVLKRKSVLSEGAEITTQKTTQKILTLIKQNPYITRKELSATVGITENGIKFSLNQLKKKHLIKRLGPDKGGYWEVLEK